MSNFYKRPSLADDNRKWLREIAPSCDRYDMAEAISYISCRGSVTHAIINMTGTYKSFIENYFSNVKTVVDKFHANSSLFVTLDFERGTPRDPRAVMVSMTGMSQE